MSLYFGIFGFLARPRIEKADIPIWKIHSHLLFSFATGFLMWSYTAIAMHEIGNSLAGILGVIFSLGHALNIFTWRFVKSPLIVASLTLFCGMLMIANFSYFTGGFRSFALIWFVIFPIFGGVVAGKKGIYIWSIVALVLISMFLAAELFGYDFPNLLSDKGHRHTQIILTYGLQVFAVGLILIYAHYNKKSYKNLEEKNLQVQNLLQLLIHDVTNPLLVAMAQVEMMQKKVEEPVEKRLDRLGKMKKSLAVIGSLSKRVRDYHSAELDDVSLQRDQCTIEDCYNFICFIFGQKFKAKNISFEFESFQDSYTFYTDKEALQNQVLLNLISNAIKFSEVGSKIILSLKKYPGGVEICVRDYGVGMDQKCLSRLKTYGATPSTDGTGGETGTGFGLRIVKTFVGKLGGKLSITSVQKTGSTKDHGTSFSIMLPDL